MVNLFAKRSCLGETMTNRRLALLTAVLVLLCATGAWSLDGGLRAQSGTAGETTGQPQARADPAIADLRGEWHRVGPGFACQVKAPKALPRDAINPEVLARACLHMGPLVIGGAKSTLTWAVGVSSRTLPQPKGAIASVYFLDRPGRHPYLIVTVLQDRIVALQVTGPAPAPAKDFSFNHVDLGVSTDTLIQVFGQPKHLEPSSEKETDLWSYTPWPFSFEVKDGHVTSIRIADPGYF
jgi:hypothetical protein